MGASVGARAGAEFGLATLAIAPICGGGPSGGAGAWDDGVGAGRSGWGGSGVLGLGRGLEEGYGSGGGEHVMEGSDTARKALQQAQANHEWTKGHDRLCEERYKNIERQLEEIKRDSKDMNAALTRFMETSATSMLSLRTDISTKISEVHKRIEGDRTRLGSWQQWLYGGVIGLLITLLLTFAKGLGS